MNYCKYCGKELRNQTNTVCEECEKIIINAYNQQTLNIILKPTKLLLVEDGSVDLDKIDNLEECGIQVIVYRQGSRKPELIDLGDKKNG